VTTAIAGLATWMLLSARPVAQSAARVAPAVAVASTAPVAPALLESPGWTESSRWISNQPQSVAFQLEAGNRIAVWMKRVRPVLVVRCLARTTDAFVFTESAARIEEGRNDHTVRVRFDDDAAVTARWVDSAEHDALFAPDPVAFARHLAGARTMQFTFTPHNALPAVVQFDVTGFGRVINQVSQRCHWR
jgi:hypothetical protein